MSYAPALRRPEFIALLSGAATVGCSLLAGKILSGSRRFAIFGACDLNHVWQGSRVVLFVGPECATRFPALGGGKQCLCILKF